MPLEELEQALAGLQALPPSQHRDWDTEEIRTILAMRNGTGARRRGWPKSARSHPTQTTIG